MRNEPVVLVHGLGSSFEHGWRPAGWIDLLSDAGRKVVPVDILGHGTADAPHDPEAYAHLERSVIAALPDEPVDAIGFSMGAQLLLRAASQQPERFGRLVAIGVGTNVFEDRRTDSLAVAFEQGRAADDDIGARLRTARGERRKRSPRDRGVPAAPDRTIHTRRRRADNGSDAGDHRRQGLRGSRRTARRSDAQRGTADSSRCRPLPRDKSVRVHRRRARVRRRRRSDDGYTLSDSRRGASATDSRRKSASRAPLSGRE